MATKKQKNSLKDRTPEELHKLVGDKREELRTLRFNVAGSKNKNVKAAKGLRRDIARALTALNAAKN